MSRVLVVDTNVLHYVPEPVLAALVQRGYTLRASVIGLEERLARAATEGTLARLRSRLRRVASYVDADEPLVPLGGPLYARAGVLDPDPARQERDRLYNATLPQHWRALIADGDLPGWEGLSAAIKESIDSSATFFQSAHEPLRTTPREGVTYGAVRAVALRWQRESNPVGRHLGTSRLDAYVGRLASILLQTDPLSANDVEDLALLEHLVEDVVLVTRDHRLIAKVDETGSFQAPFVRSPWEILDGLAPSGPPWGPTAMEAGLAHRARTRKSLATVEKKVKAALGVTERPDGSTATSP